MASALCKRRVSPPEKPLLIHLALLSHLKMIGMKSFHATISNIPALVAPTVDIFPGILSSALASEPRSENCHFNRKQSDVVLTYESKHPYENSSDIYTPVSAPGAVRLSIVFDPETSTESGCDYVVFYTDSTHSKKVPNSDQFSGGKDGSSSNWPGVKNNPPFVVEGDSFVIYFHSDGSVNDWGYKMYVTAEFSSDMDDSRLMIRGNNMNAMTALRSCFYVQQLLLDGVGKPWEKVLMPVMPLKSLGFPIENAPEKSMAYLEYSPRFLNNSEETVNSGFTLQEEKEETSFAEEKVDESIVLTIVPNSVVASVKKVKVVKSDKIYEAPDANDVPSANPNVLGDTIVDEVYIVRKEILDWVLVQRAPVVTAVLPRVIDVFSLFDEGEEESPLKSDNGSDDNSNSSKPVNTADDGGDSGAWLRRRADDNIYLQSVVEDKESAAATSDPKQTTNPIDKKDDKKKNKAEKNKATREALTRHPMYSINDMEKVIRDQITINDSSVDSIQLLRSELNTLETSLYEYSVIAANGYAYECLGIIIDNWHEAEKPFNMHYFETTSNLLTYLHKSIIDSNINNNTDGITKHERFFKFLSSILLESTDQRTSKVLSTNSFGTLVDAALQVGCDLIDFAKQELVRATVCEDVSMSTVQLGYWLLKSFVSTRSPNVNQFLLNLDTFSILRKFFDSDISINMRSEILLLFINFIQQLSETNQASEELIEELHALNSSLIFTAQIQYIKDTRNGQEMLYITQYLQAIIEVALSTQDTIGKLINTRASKVSTQSPLVGRSKEVFIETEFTRAGMKTFHAVNDSSVLKQKYFSQVVESCTAFGLFRANFLIKELSSNDHPCFGILIDSNKGSYKFDCNFQLGFRSNEISLCNGRLINGNESIECNCIIRKGDILTIEVDLTKSLSVTYYKNGVMVVDAVGLTGSQALLQMNKVPDISLEVSIIISIANDEDVIQLVPDVFSPKPRSLVDNTTLTASAIDQDSVESLPEWLQPVRDAYLMLKSLEGNEIPKYILDNKFMPFCRQMSTVPALLSFDDSNEGLSQSAKVSKGDNSIKTEISIEGATRISIVVGHLKVRDCDTLEIYNKENVLIMKVSGKQSISVYGSLNEYFQDVHKEVKYPNGDVLTNRAGVKIALGSGGGKSNYYCGRNLGRKQIPHSDGCCGPSNGPQCKDCKGFTESKPPVLKVPKATKDGDSAVEFASDFNNLQLDIHVGDVVVRGPDWSYGNEDGGAGEVGEVLSIQSWQGVPSVGVQVRWRENKFTSVYRYGLDGAYDLSIFLPIAGESRHFISESIIRKLPDRGVVHIPGSALTMILRKGAEELATNEIEQIFFPKAFCWCVPSYRLSDVMSIPKFQPFLTHLRSLFVSQFLSGDIALVNHINNYARTKNISLTELFRKKWVELAPSSEDLTRSPALKVL